MDKPKETAEQFREELSAFFDNELSTDDRTQMEERLTECKESANQFENLKVLSTLIKDSTEEVEVPDIWNAIKDDLPPVEELVEDDLSAYLDGELPQAAADGVKLHLEENEELMEKFKLLNKTNQLLSKSMELPEDIEVNLWDDIKARLTTDCEIIRSELSPYLDQEVVTHRHRAITAHLVDCLDCRNQFETMSSVGNIINEHYTCEVPEDLDLWPDVKKKLKVVPFRQKKSKQAKQAQPVLLRPRVRVMAVAAAAVIGLLGTVAIWLASPDDQEFIPITAEEYLIESSFEETSNVAEAVIYEQ